MLWLYSMWSGFKHLYLLNNSGLWEDILTDLPQMTNHLILLSLSACLTLSTFYLTDVCDKINFKFLLQPLQPQLFILSLCCCFHSDLQYMCVDSIKFPLCWRLASVVSSLLLETTESVKSTNKNESFFSFNQLCASLFFCLILLPKYSGLEEG